MGNANTTNNNCGEGYLLQAQSIIDGKIKVNTPNPNVVGPSLPVEIDHFTEATQEDIHTIVEGLVISSVNPECFGSNLLNKAKHLEKASRVNTGLITKEISNAVSLLTEYKISPNTDFARLTIKELDVLERLLIKALDNTNENNPNSGNPKLIELLEKVKSVKISESNKKIKKGEETENTQELLKRQEDKKAQAA